MRKNFILLIFGLMIINIFGNELNKMKLINSEISRKEMELKKLKERKKLLQEKKDNINPPIKVGLVLSGGGAKGLAHVGALRVIEEYGIHVDYITGTSFGSIVGALYAIGYTPDQIEKIMLDMDWDSFKNNSDDRKYTSLKYKTQEEKYFMNLEIEDDYSLKIPKGVFTGQSFYLELKKLLSSVEGVNDFDDFPIPFRAISTNINTGERNVVGEGDLPKAVFMSMAIPTVLDPIKDKGEYYVDGGLVENLPVREVIEMGADVVIAVDISAASNTIDSNSNVFEILEKMTSYRKDEQIKKAQELADILIVPDVKSHSVADFTGLELLIKKGEEETIKHKVELKKIGEIQREEGLKYLKTDDLHTLEELPQKKIIIRKKEEKLEKEIERKMSIRVAKKIKINEIVLVGNEDITIEKVEVLSKKELPAEYTQEEIITWMNKLKAEDPVRVFYYTIEGNKLTIDIEENLNKNLRVGLNFSDDFGPTLRIGTTFKKYGLLDNEYMVMLELSEYPKVEFETIIDYKYKETAYIGFLGAGIDTNPLFIYDGNDQVTTYNNYTLYLSGGVGTSIFNSYLFATRFYYMGVKNEYMNGSKKTIDHSSWEYLKNRTAIMTDTRDDTYFSEGGAFNRVEIFTGTKVNQSGDIEFYGGLYDFHKYIAVGEKFNIELFTSGGKISGSAIPENEHFKIGGLRSMGEINSFSFYGMNAMRKHVDQFYLGGVNLRYKISTNLYTNIRYNVVTYETPRFETIDENVDIGKDFKHGIGLGFGMNSFMGPLEFVVSNDADSNGAMFSLFLGYEF